MAQITFEDKQLNVDDLPDDIKELVLLYTMWEEDLIRQKREVFKTEAALRGLTDEIQARLKTLLGS